MLSALFGMHPQESDEDTVKIPISSILLLLSAMRCRRCSSYSTSAMIACVVPTAKGAVQRANLFRVTTPGKSSASVHLRDSQRWQRIHPADERIAGLTSRTEGGKGKMPMWR